MVNDRKMNQCSNTLERAKATSQISDAAVHCGLSTSFSWVYCFLLSGSVKEDDKGNFFASYVCCEQR